MDNSFIIFKYIANSNIKEIKKLLEKDKNLIYIIGPNLQLPIHDACLQGNKEVIDLLLSYDKKILNKVNTNKNGRSVLGTYNLIGNVWEYVGSKNNKNEVITKGGGWSTELIGLNSSSRYIVSKNARFSNVGFRCARDF